MPLSPAHLRELADRVEAEEAEAERELREADTDAERKALRDELEQLKAKHAILEQQLAERDEPPEPIVDPVANPPVDPSVTPEPKPKMRKGRKHGMVYLNEETGLGEVYQGEDEPDLVPVEEEAA